MNRSAFHSLCMVVTAIAILASEPSPGTAANTQNAGWTPRGMMSYKRPAVTALSPDGRFVAYTVTEAETGEGKSSYLTHVWVAATDGSSNRQFTTGDSSCRNPSFSPDSRSLAFTSSRAGGKTQVFVLPLDGGEAWQATNAATGVGEYAWSPDGSQIAYLMTDPETDTETAAKKAKRDWTVRDEDYKFAHLYVTALKQSEGDSTAARRLTSGAFHVESFDWSPDGKTIVFSHRTTPSANDWKDTDISVVTLGNGAVTPLVARPGADRYPKYSPDGQWVAFSSDFEKSHWAFLCDAYIVPARSGKPVKLAETPDRNFMYYGAFLGWSPDGKELYAYEAEKTSWRVFAIPVDGGKIRVLTPGEGTVGSVSFNRSGSMAFISETCDTPPDVYVADLRRFEPRKLTAVNAGYATYQMGKTEVIEWRSKDGRTIEGLLTYPAGYTPGRKYPLILNIHGGPAGVFTQSYTAASGMYPLQAFSQAGYAVLRANTRGSSGYGMAFRHANINDWGEGDFEDQMAGVDTVIARGIAHPESLCVTGWSYGGYMTATVVTKTHRFKAAVMGAGISDLASFTGTADIPGFIPDYFEGEPWEKPETYIRHSPVYNAKGIVTPTLILHGSLDARVPLGQGEEFYNALKRQGCATRLVVYPRSSHSPSEPEFVIDIGERVIAWFDRYLGRTTEH